MTFDEYEAAASRTMNPALSPSHVLLDAAAGLAEEAGEVLGAVRKHLFQEHPLDRERLQKELGDALWCLTISARAAGLSLDAVAHANIEKLRRRYPEGFTTGASTVRADER
jgi:NTP pyrophosphatase (non-canonical NTP hydrolase)